MIPAGVPFKRWTRESLLLGQLLLGWWGIPWQMITTITTSTGGGTTAIEGPITEGTVAATAAIEDLAKFGHSKI